MKLRTLEIQYLPDSDLRPAPTNPRTHSDKQIGQIAECIKEFVFTDPPYNVPIDGHVCGLGSVQHREFAMATGEMSKPEFTDFLAIVLGHVAASSIDGSIHFVCMD